MFTVSREMKHGAVILFLFAGACAGVFCWQRGRETRTGKTGLSQPGDDAAAKEEFPTGKMASVTAKNRIADFAAIAEPVRHPELAIPQMPSVPKETLQALRVLEDTDDTEYMTDVAAVLVRYAADVHECSRTGGLMDRRHPLTKAFILKLQPTLPGDEISSACLADWICENRGKMGASDLLDKEIAKYRQVRQRRDAELSEPR